jgi:DNA polymerase III alpha subunit
MSKTFDLSIFDDPIGKTITEKFVRKCPNKRPYIDRLINELKLIVKKEFFEYILQVVELLDLVKDIPHIIRGSAGSSLVNYLLGITDIDPVKENISFGRFLNETRSTMPDIDFDFPHKHRDIVFSRINEHWKGRVARISNHVMYQTKSATREAIRQTMIAETGKSTRIAKNKCDAKFYPEWKLEINKKKEELIGTMRCYSLHCGGIVIYDDKVPEDIILKENQIKYNKDDIADEGLFKIDILSNRGLSQLFETNEMDIEDYPETDINITKLFERGRNIGLTFAESPAMRKVLCQIKPKNYMDIAFALALIRPAAARGYKSKAIQEFERGEFGNYLIFDDDAIQHIQSSIKCDESQADKYRRAFSKGKQDVIKEFENIAKSFKNKNEIMGSLHDLRRYSFCKSHAISYAKLVWALAYNRVYYPKKFWLSTLNNCNSSYRKWVHYIEAKRAGIELCFGKKQYKLENDKLIGSTEVKEGRMTATEEYLKYGYWLSKDFLPDMYLEQVTDYDAPLEENTICVKFRGLIAISRNYKGKGYGKATEITYVTIGYDNGKYVDISIPKKVNVGYCDVISGVGIMKSYGSGKVKMSYNTNKIEPLNYKIEKIK